MDVSTLGAYQVDKARYGVENLQRLAKQSAENGGGPKGLRFKDVLAKTLQMPEEIGIAKAAPQKPAMPGYERTPFSIPNENPRDEKLFEQCRALETFLLKNMISGMRKTVDKSDFNKSGFAGEMYEDMLYDEYAKSFSENAGFGFAELAYLELTGQRGKLLKNRA
ncbi:hypothetical protein FACS1894190_16700 [Spirochaetia bacterium]|nr:hypothetical protein FACS1894190_16700 [Spirochaetia bacterium]